MHFLNNYSYIGLKLRGDPVINVITTEETYSWEKKDETPDKKYYAVYANGGYYETEKFDPDDVIKYYVDTGETFSSKRIEGELVNKVIKPTVMDNNYALIDPDDRILGIINAVEDSIEHAMLRIEIFTDKDKYFVFIWLNVNLISPCELYEYDIESKSIHRLCWWDDVDIVGISIPDSTKEFDSV